MLGARALDVFPGNTPNIPRPGAFKNQLLRNLDAATIGRLRLRPINLECGHEIEFPGKPIDHLFFIEEGVGSMTITFMDGSQVESGLFGYESVMGVSGLMGTRQSLNRVYMQIAGRGFTAPIAAAREEFERCSQFQHLTLRYVQSQLTRSNQTIGCNAKHGVEERLAKWLLRCADRAGTNTFSISHEFLADMLGSTRPTVSVVAADLKLLRLIDYSRGTIRILDPKGLEEKSCECYRVIKDHLDNNAEFDNDAAA
jgi:CRP-like cAMP-binding protein